ARAPFPRPSIRQRSALAPGPKVPDYISLTPLSWWALRLRGANAVVYRSCFLPVDRLLALPEPSQDFRKLELSGLRVPLRQSDAAERGGRAQLQRFRALRPGNAERALAAVPAF